MVLVQRGSAPPRVRGMGHEDRFMSRRLTMIDLFAGAGGLSLGLEAAGFRPVLAVERSPMAAETYFRNFIDRDSNGWLRHLACPLPDQMRAGLAVAPTAEVLAERATLLDLARPGELDLLAGGPPCQGFSVAGQRDPNDRRNKLPLEFLQFVELLRPRAVLVENVVGFGISFSPRPEDAALEQLRQALSARGYLAQILEVNAVNFGVAQDRPRIMIAAVRRDLLDGDVLRSQEDRANQRWSSARLELEPPLLAPQGEVRPVRTVREAIDDLMGHDYTVASPDDYPRDLSFARDLRLSVGYPRLVGLSDGDPLPGPPNHEMRRHSPRTTFRFQVRHALARQGVTADVFYSGGYRTREMLVAVLGRVDLPLHDEDGMEITGPDGPVGNTAEDLAREVLKLATWKHSQRVLAAGLPSRTVLTLPDDLIHYRAPRILTVREAARIQSFPDAFRFFSKVTTGGQMRRSEVPQYSQVGNAVPPLLAVAVGRHLQRVIHQLGERGARSTAPETYAHLAG